MMLTKGIFFFIRLNPQIFIYELGRAGVKRFDQLISLFTPYGIRFEQLDGQPYGWLHLRGKSAIGVDSHVDAYR